jgi:hypothetical protein
MKKILFILALISILSCSKTEEEAINPLKEKLVGSWRFVGNLHYDVDHPDGELFDPVENGNVLKFYNNDTYENNLITDFYYQYGDYNVSSQDSILNRSFNQSYNQTSYGSEKITKLTTTTLELSPLNENIGIDNHLSISRYERIITP